MAKRRPDLFEAFKKEKERIHQQLNSSSVVSASPPTTQSLQAQETFAPIDDSDASIEVTSRVVTSPKYEHILFGILVFLSITVGILAILHRTNRDGSENMSSVAPPADEVAEIRRIIDKRPSLPTSTPVASTKRVTRPENTPSVVRKSTAPYTLRLMSYRPSVGQEKVDATLKFLRDNGFDPYLHKKKNELVICVGRFERDPIRVPQSERTQKDKNVLELKKTIKELKYPPHDSKPFYGCYIYKIE